MWKIVNVTDGATEEIGFGESGNWPGSILEIGAELYEVQLSEETGGDGLGVCHPHLAPPQLIAMLN